MRQRSGSLYNKRTLEKFYEEIFEDEGFKEEKIATKTKGGGLAGRVPRKSISLSEPDLNVGVPGIRDPSFDDDMLMFGARSKMIAELTKGIVDKTKEVVFDLSPRAEAGEVEETTGKAPKGADKLLQDQEFMNQLAVMQDKYPKLSSQEIFSVIQGESSFRSNLVNPNSKAKGLFQITEEAAKEAGINYGNLENMNPAEQLKEYDKYLQRWGYDGSYSLGILQAAPSFRNASSDTVVYTKKKNKRVFELNPKWFNEDGIATVGSINNYYGY